MAIYSKKTVVCAVTGKQSARAANDANPSPDTIVEPFNGATRDAGEITLLRRYEWLVALVRDPNLSGFDKAVASVIIEHVNARSGLAWPSRQTIARLAMCNPSSVKRALRKLVARGWLHVEAGGVHAGGRHFSSRFRPIFPATSQAGQGVKFDPQTH